MQKILIVSPKTISLQGFDGAQKGIFDIAKFLPMITINILLNKFKYYEH